MLYYITENKDKIANALRNLEGTGIKLEPKGIELQEIQSDNVEEIIKEKAKYAYSTIKKPLIVNDASWEITGLNGFPGPYMKYINQWFHAFDFINLMGGHLNREIIFHDALYYIDENHEQFFEEKIAGEFLLAPKGNGKSSDQVVTFRRDKKTIAICHELSIDSFDSKQIIWKKFADWYKSEITSQSSPQPSQ